MYDVKSVETTDHSNEAGLLRDGRRFVLTRFARRGNIDFDWGDRWTGGCGGEPDFTSKKYTQERV